MAKKKRLTQRDKAIRAEVKKDLQAKGVIPPDKPRLNRKRFAKEVWDDYLKMTNDYEAYLYILKAIGCMVGPTMHEVTPEQVGVLKVLKIAIETKRFMEALKAEDKSEYTIGEFFDKVVFPIMELQEAYKNGYRNGTGYRCQQVAGAYRLAEGQGVGRRLRDDPARQRPIQRRRLRP